LIGFAQAPIKGSHSNATSGSAFMASARATTAIFIILLASSDAFGQQTIMPGSMPRIGEVDPRFQSYNIEMVTVTGGRFWKPYGAPPHRELYAVQPPIDLANPRLRKLAAALGPAYMRVSGSWANATYFADSDDSSGPPPAGYEGVLTHARWRGAVDFAAAIDAQIVTSFAVSPGSRDAGGAWKPEQAERLLAYTRSLGARIAAAEFMNEPDLAPRSAAPPGYDAAAYGRDFRTFHAFMKTASPETVIAGPGSIGDGAAPASNLGPRDLLAASGGDFDVISYHHYGALSPRCGGRDRPEQALTEARLSRIDQVLAFYKTLRDRYAPGKPIWLTETADAACGGNPWDTTFLDSFRYLDQLGRLAKSGVEVVMHNTLSGSDYGLLDEQTFAPRPNYWAALLWHRLMGTTVLDAAGLAQSGLHVYSHCGPGEAGGVTILVINGSDKRHAFTVPIAAMRYTLHAPHLQSSTVQLNATRLSLRENDALPEISGKPTAAGMIAFAPRTITFLAIQTAANPACR
jgi:Glycosyl hydrolase family 79, N-terminal domain